MAEAEAGAGGSETNAACLRREGRQGVGLHVGERGAQQGPSF